MRNTLNNPHQISKEIRINITNERQNLFRSINLIRKIESKDDIKLFENKGFKNINGLGCSPHNRKKEKESLNNLNRESISSAFRRSKMLRKIEEENIKDSHINHPYCNISVNFIKCGDEEKLNEFYNKKNHLKQIISSASDVNKIQDNNNTKDLNLKFDVTIAENPKLNHKINYLDINGSNVIEMQSEAKAENPFISDGSSYNNKKSNDQNSKTEVKLNNDSLKNQSYKIEKKDKILDENHSISDLNIAKFSSHKNEDKLSAFNLETQKEENEKQINNNEKNNNNTILNNNRQSLLRKCTVTNQSKNTKEILLRKNLTIKAKNLDSLLNRKDKTYSVLVVDDSVSIRSSCKFILLKLEKIRSCKMSIDEADDGFAGLNLILNNLIKEKKYDLIILDDEMTYLNGSEMIKMIDMIIDRKFGERIGLKKDLFEKFVVCSANPENLVHKIIVKNVKIFPKPLSLNYLQSYFDNLG